LPPDVQVLPVRQLPRDLVDAFEHDDDDFAVTRPRSRSPSCVVDAETAALLEEFRAPRLIIEAVMRRSLETRADPQEMLDAAYPSIERLITTRLLVPVESADAAAIGPTLEKGERHGDYT